MKDRIVSLIKSYLAAYALTISFRQPLQIGAYEEKIDYITASVYELLGNYNFTFFLIGALAFCAFEWYRHKGNKPGLTERLTAVFPAMVLLLGNSFYASNSWDLCFGSVVNLVKTAISFCGYYFMFTAGIDVIFRWMEHFDWKSKEVNFYTKRPFLKSFLILSVIYLAVLILSFPGNLCWDVIGQIEQVTVKETGFDAHHPLVHTLMVGGLTRLGEIWFGSQEIGLFIYMLVQNLMLITALSATVAVLARYKVRAAVLTGLLVLYCVSPIYTNLASTAIKDIPFISFVIGYIICYAMLLHRPELIRNVRFVTLFVLMQIGVILMRNNGLPLIVACGVVAVPVLWKKYQWKERAGSVVALVIAGAVTGKIIMMLTAAVLGAEEGGMAEMFSLPMQQTARYLKVYEAELTETERAGIEGVFGDVTAVADAYDPDIADPVKAMFDNSAPLSAVMDYFKAWFIGLCKHPMIYAEAFLNHVYGWFTPSVSNAPRYETDYPAIGQGMLFPGADKVMIFLYRFAERVPGLGLLQNVGIYVWGMILLTVWLFKKRDLMALTTTSPLWISLLACMISPCFFLHPRYALPIIMGLPFVWIYVFSGEENKK